jgi:hypothetical protein
MLTGGRPEDRSPVAAIRAFAGPDVERAKYDPEDREFLLELEPRVVHYEVVGPS